MHTGPFWQENVKEKKIIAKSFVIQEIPLVLIYEIISTSKLKVMNKMALFAFPWLFSLISYKALAQEEVIVQGQPQKKSEEIIIRKNGDKDVNVTIQINGDQVTVNGKPINEYKDGEVTVNRRKVTVRNGNGRQLFISDDVRGPQSFSQTEDENNAGKKAFLGVTTQQKDDREGAEIISVTSGSAADKAGLTEGDVITKINDYSVTDPNTLAKAVTANKPGDEVKVYYLRNGKKKNAKVKLGEQAVSRVRSFAYTMPNGGMRSFSFPNNDLNIQGNITTDDNFDFSELERNMERFNNLDFNVNSITRRPKIGLRIQDTDDNSGVKVLDVEDSTAAASAGLRKDDVITEICGVKVNNTDDAREQMAENSQKTYYAMKARRDGKEMEFQIKIPRKLKTANF